MIDGETINRNPIYLLLLCGSIVLNYVVGSVMSAAAGKARTLWLVFLVGANLGLLGYFKYRGFFAEISNSLISTDLPEYSLVLPIAISFFTFQQIAWQVDVYKKLVVPEGFSRYALFVSFFPQLIAGPIVHHSEMMPQFRGNRVHGDVVSNMQVGLFILSIGLLKKVIMADGAGEYATPVFEQAEAGAQIDLLQGWMGALCYTVQIYFDFSAYSDMAVGTARMFGIRLPTNFFSPYKSVSIVEFWRRWHITLSRFLKDYLYIPLGGNRRGEPRRYGNILITMVLGGLWHGAGWTFIVWGACHGVFLIINHGWEVAKRAVPWLAAGMLNPVRRAAAWTLTMIAVVSSWVVFRAESFPAALAVLKGMAGLNGLQIHPSVIATLGIDPVWFQQLGLTTSVEGILAGELLTGWGYAMLLMIVAVGFPNIYQVTRLYAPTLDFEAHQHCERSSALVWRPTAVFGVAFGLVSVVAVLALFGTTASEFLYFQF